MLNRLLGSIPDVNHNFIINFDIPSHSQYTISTQMYAQTMHIFEASQAWYELIIRG